MPAFRPMLDPSTAKRGLHRSGQPARPRTGGRHCRTMHLGTPLQLLDLDRLDHLSRELAGAAAELTRSRTALRTRATGLQWHSAGATAFQAVLHDVLGQLGHCGSRLIELSAAVRAHRQRAAGRAATVARLAHSALGTVERVVRLP
jgi:hypothetical protein